MITLAVVAAVITRIIILTIIIVIATIITIVVIIITQHFSSAWSLRKQFSEVVLAQALLTANARDRLETPKLVLPKLAHALAGPGKRNCNAETA